MAESVHTISSTTIIVPTKSGSRSLAIILIALTLAIKVLAAPTYVQSAIEAAEVSSGICLQIDPDCSIEDQKSVNLGENPSSQVHLSHHLLGCVDSAQCDQHGLSLLSETIHADGIDLPLWIFSTSIFHPPKPSPPSFSK